MNDGERETMDFLRMQREEYLDSCNIRLCSICNSIIEDNRASSICQKCEDKAEMEARKRGE